MQGEFIIYPQKLKHAAEEYQSMCRLLSHAAERISDIEKELDASSYNEIKGTLRTLHDSVTCHADNLQQLETILYDCATEYTGTEKRLHAAFSPENTSESADSKFSVLENGAARKSDASIPEPVKKLLDALQAGQDAFLSDMEKEDIAAALKNILLPAAQASSEMSVSDAVEKYLAEELRENEVHLNASEAFRASGTDSAFADSGSSMDSYDLSGNSGSSSGASENSGSSGGASGGSESSGSSGGANTSSSSAGSVSRNGAAAKWTKAAPVLPAADGVKNYGAYTAGNQPLEASIPKTTAIPDATAETSSASPLFSEHAGSSILAAAALGTAGVIGAGFAHKSKTKTE